MLFEKNMIEVIDNWSFANRVRTRAEAIRQLIDRGLRQTPADNSQEVNAKA